MTSEVNENKIAGELSQPPTLRLNNNNDNVLNCISPTCSRFSKKVGCSDEKYAFETSRDAVKDDTQINNKEQQLLANEIGKKSPQMFSSLNEENAKVNETNKISGQKEKINFDRCPSRWLPSEMAEGVEQSEKGSLQISLQKQQNSSCIETKTIDCKNSQRTNFQKSNLICDQNRVLSSGCDQSGAIYHNSFSPIGNERELLGKEAIEELASELNKAATTIQDFAQNECDEQILKQLNDEQLFKLLEEAYHSKKLDEKNKSSIFKEILEDVNESIIAEGKHTSFSSSILSDSGVLKTDSLAATKELLQTKILGIDENRPKSMALSPKITKISPRIPSSYPWKENIKNSKPIGGTEMINDKLESPCLWMSRTSSTKSSETRHNEPYSSNQNEIKEMEIDEELEQDIKLGAIQKHILPKDGMMSNPMGARNLDENGNPINIAATEPRLPRSNLGLGSVSMAPCGTTSATCRQLRPLSIYRHNPAFHSQHVAAVGGPSQMNSEEGNNLSDTSPPAPTLQQRHQQQRMPSPTPIPSPFSSSSAIATPTHPMTEDMEKVANLSSGSKTLRKKKKTVKATMLKAEEIDGYRGCDDLDSILKFIEKGEEKRGKPGVKRAPPLVKNRAESPPLSGSVATKERSKQQQQGKIPATIGLESNSKNTTANKKTARKRSQTPADGKVLTHEKETTRVDENTLAPHFSSSPELLKKCLDKKQDIATLHSSSCSTKIEDEELHERGAMGSSELKVDSRNNDDSMSESIDEKITTKIDSREVYDVEEDDDDDTPFVMIRRVNNHSNLNKSTKSKTYVDNSTQGVLNKNSSLSSNGTRNNNNRYGNKPNLSNTGRSTLKRKSKHGTNEVEEYSHKNASDNCKEQPSTQETQLSTNKSNGHNRSYADNKSSTHGSGNENKLISDDHNVAVIGNFSRAPDTAETMSSNASEGSISNNFNTPAADSSIQNLTSSFSSVVQAKKGNKTSRGKPKSKGANGFNHKQFIDAALNDPISESKQNNSNDSTQSNCSDSSKLKISNTFVAEAMLPEPVLEYSRKHSSHSPPPTHHNVDLKNTHPREVSLISSKNMCKGTVHSVQEEKMGQIINTAMKDGFNEQQSNANYTNSDNNDSVEDDKNMEYNSGDIIGFGVPHEYIDDDMDESTPCNNTHPKSYSSAVTASTECKNTIDIKSTRASNIDGNYVRGIKSDDERIEETIEYKSRKENEDFSEQDGYKGTNIVCKSGLSTSTSPISSRSSSFTWYEEEEDCTEGTFNYTTILNFIKSEWESITTEISNGENNVQSKVVYYKA